MAPLPARRDNDRQGRENPTPDPPVRSSRRRTLAAAATALASALALAACGIDELPETVAPPAPRAGTDLRNLIESTPDLVVAGKHLDTKRLQGFYARHGYEPVWAARRDQAESLLQAVLRARGHGLDPETFHAALLQDGTTLPPLDRELLESDAFLSYADALARGAVPVERRRSDQVLAPDPVDLPAVLDQAAESADPAAVIEALAPATPAYRALRNALADLRSEASVGKPVPPNRLRAIEVNLERQRWLPRQLPPDRVWVNVADERLSMYRAGRLVLSTRVVVGEDVQRNQSPEFRTTIDASFYNPPWVIPADIARAEILPRLGQDPDYLTRNRMVMLANDEVEQLPGPDAGLGLVMFDMPNRFDVYLHDTPDRHLFDRDNRRISHGCIRVQHPRELAALLLGQPLEAVDQGIATGNTTRNVLPAPVPVFVVYQTAFLNDGEQGLQFRPDFYDRDGAIWQQLQPSAQPAGSGVVRPRGLTRRTAMLPTLPVRHRPVDRALSRREPARKAAPAGR